MYLCTCHTEGCENAEHAIELQLDIDLGDGETYHVETVMCGVCGEPIADVVPA